MKRYISILESQDDVKPGDIILTGKFLNKKAVVKSFGTNDKGQPTVITDTGKEIPLYKFRIEKLMAPK